MWLCVDQCGRLRVVLACSQICVWTQFTTNLPLESTNRTHTKMHVHVSNVNTRGLCSTTTNISFGDRKEAILTLNWLLFTANVCFILSNHKIARLTLDSNVVLQAVHQCILKLSLHLRCVMNRSRLLSE